MKVGLAVALACVLPAALLRPARGQQAKAEPSAADVVGSYAFSHQWGGSVLTFAEGGKYASRSNDCTQQYLSEGTYEVAGGRVLVSVRSRKQWPHGRPEAAEEIKPEPGEPADDKPERLVPVGWGQRLYLVDEGDLLMFCNAVNAGFEPRGGEDDPAYAPLLYGPYLGAFYLREGDEKKRAEGQPRLPAEWRRFILKGPVKGSVLSFAGGQSEAVVSVGARDGLLKGMMLFLEGEGRDVSPTLYDAMEVLSVSDETAVVRGVEGAKVGDKVSTRFEPPKEFR